MNSCGFCDAVATHSCTRCGIFCCADHITRYHAIKYAGAVCTNCGSWSWVSYLLGLPVLVVIGCVFYFSFIAPQRDENAPNRQPEGPEWRGTEKEREEAERRPGVRGFDR